VCVRTFIPVIGKHMKMVAASVALVAAGSCWMAGQSVTAGTTHADNATPAATTTVTPGTPAVVPSAKSLLALAAAQFTVQKSFHVAGSIHESVTGETPGSLTIASESDISVVKPQQEHTTATRSITGGVTSIPPIPPLEIARRGNRLAVRSGTGPWQCTKVKTLPASTPLPITLSPKNSSSLGGTTHISKLANLGTETIDGTLVWHIYGAGIYVPMTKKVQKSKVQLDIYVTKSDFTVRRYSVVETSPMKKGKLTVNITEDFSMYGEPVNVVLPAECNTISHLEVSALGLPLASVAPDPWTLIPQLRVFLRPVT